MPRASSPPFDGLTDTWGRRNRKLERMEPCRATSEYLNRPCRSPAELEAMLRARADTTAAREGV